jgi:hypothetical protein
MRRGFVANVTVGDCARLGAVVANRNSPQKRVWRPASRRFALGPPLHMGVFRDQFLVRILRIAPN